MPEIKEMQIQPNTSGEGAGKFCALTPPFMGKVPLHKHNHKKWLHIIGKLSLEHGF